MFFASSSLFVLSAISLVSAHAIPRSSPPSSWDSNGLEDYSAYHCRYLALGCQYKYNNATFFDACCQPLLANETASSLPADCQMPQGVNCSHGEPVTPSGTYSVAQPTSSPSLSPSYPPSPSTGTVGAYYQADADCDGEPYPSSSPSAEPTYVPPSTSPSAGPTYVPPSTSPSAEPTYTPPSTSPSAEPTYAPPSTSPSAEPTFAPPSTSPPAEPTYTPSPTYSPQEPTTTPNSINAAPSPSAAPANPASRSGAMYTGGIATYFYQDGVAGACGQVHPDSAMICALDTPMYAGGSHCGQQVQITNTQTGKSVVVTVADECPTCDNADSIDLSVAAFQQLASLDQGTFPISWSFV